MDYKPRHPTPGELAAFARDIGWSSRDNAIKRPAEYGVEELTRIYETWIQWDLMLHDLRHIVDIDFDQIPPEPRFEYKEVFPKLIEKAGTKAKYEPVFKESCFKYFWHIQDMQEKYAEKPVGISRKRICEMQWNIFRHGPGMTEREIQAIAPIYKQAIREMQSKKAGKREDRQKQTRPRNRNAVKKNQ